MQTAVEPPFSLGAPSTPSPITAAPVATAPVSAARAIEVAGPPVPAAPVTAWTPITPTPVATAPITASRAVVAPLCSLHLRCLDVLRRCDRRLNVRWPWGGQRVRRNREGFRRLSSTGEPRCYGDAPNEPQQEFTSIHSYSLLGSPLLLATPTVQC